MTTDSATIQRIPDNKPVRIFLPLTGKSERYRTSCVFQQTEPPAFNLLFKSGELPVELLNTQELCIISIDMGGPNLSLEAKIKHIKNDQTLTMTLHKTISHEQMRDFFRVDATTSVISSSFHPQFYDKEGEPWAIQGETIDISGSGLLATFSEMPPEDKQVKLTISLPGDEPEILNLIAHPVRSEKSKDNQYLVAYQFDDIATEDRDKIIGCCLVIQRKLLRLKVKVKDQL